MFVSTVQGPEDIAVLFDYLELLLARVPATYREIVLLRLHGHSVDANWNGNPR